MNLPGSILRATLRSAGLSLLLLAAGSARAQEGFIGEIRMFAGNFEPKNWASCNGQLLQIAQYSPLFSVIGTTYGGDGRTTFALPNLRGRVPLHMGQGTGTSVYAIGQKGGEEAVRITVGQLPKHTHTLVASGTPGASPTPGKQLVAPSGANAFGTASPVEMSSIAIGSTGGGQLVDVRQPYLTVNYIICTQGVFPARN